ncbi:MAG: hypothetical protein AVDCRST_MAG74-471 [uncultured Pyrinomonadaceae bacterium]|uniref:Uncharacterized protein n=1 Tax=uncultured Pyrinomonadaceae bacterium TaxID=2283094 RepID=A0A6J4NEL4_9BACT|nr:MAG: hypothetical protein AVDCRST_MAG74-471 [uncultured Pyrinomonadaceae bacterium]
MSNFFDSSRSTVKTAYAPESRLLLSSRPGFAVAVQTVFR